MMRACVGVPAASESRLKPYFRSFTRLWASLSKEGDGSEVRGAALAAEVGPGVYQAQGPFRTEAAGGDHRAAAWIRRGWPSRPFHIEART